MVSCGVLVRMLGRMARCRVSDACMVHCILGQAQLLSVLRRSRPRQVLPGWFSRHFLASIVREDWIEAAAGFCLGGQFKDASQCRRCNHVLYRSQPTKILVGFLRLEFLVRYAEAISEACCSVPNSAEWQTRSSITKVIGSCGRLPKKCWTRCVSEASNSGWRKAWHGDGEAEALPESCPATLQRFVLAARAGSLECAQPECMKRRLPNEVHGGKPWRFSSRCVVTEWSREHSHTRRLFPNFQSPKNPPLAVTV